MSDAMKEFFGDIPGRPDHPDFWRLSEIVLGMDAEAGDGFTKVVSKAGVDVQSLGYLADQRAGRMAWSPSVRNYAAACWVDGFIAGARYKS